MRITPGPLEIKPNDRGDGIWLMEPAKHAPAVATVWRVSGADRIAQAEGNALVMAYSSPLYDLAQRLSVAKTKQELHEVITEARRLMNEIGEKAQADPAAPRLVRMDTP